jgi:excisionase family DNA binding protein
MATTPDPAGNGHQPGPGPHPAPPEDRLLTPAEVAEILGGDITAETVVRRWRKWKLPTHKIGRELRFWESDVYAWIKDRQA